MDRNDQNAIEELFRKLAQVERTAPNRDAQSEAFIGDQIARQPSAPYYMAQTIVVQDQALAAAEKRIEELELRASRGERGGAVPAIGRQQEQPAQGGFLAGAAQTALGVAGGWLLGSAIGGMFGTSSAQASEPATSTESATEPEPQEDALAEETFADDGGDFGDFGDFDV